jgi:hypothetical protein
MGLIINNTKMGKPYINGVKHNVYIGGQKIWSDDIPTTEAFSITVQDNGSFDLPTKGVNGSKTTFQSYNWKIDWGDGTTQNVAGTGSGDGVIPHVYTDSINTHTIIIRPNGKATQGWLNAYGNHPSYQSNSDRKIISINSQITGLMRTMAPWAFYGMFTNCSGLTSIPENLLPAATLADSCYERMFYSSGLTSIPEKLLPATTLADYCYLDMFSYCIKLTSLPEKLLPATTLAISCYQNMFYGCAGLTTLPEKLLPVTTLVRHCYANMFYASTGLTSIPEKLLPATTLADYCYSDMFRITGLTSIPANLLPATTLALRCYASMFRDCQQLTSIPSNLLKATTLADYCYFDMFAVCIKLTSIPNNFLPTITTLNTGCYSQMFAWDTGLTNIGNINATWFSARNPKQSYMFYECTKITTPITYASIPTAWKTT